MSAHRPLGRTPTPAQSGDAGGASAIAALARPLLAERYYPAAERRARNVTPSVGQYLAARTAAAGDAAGMDAEGSE